ncbi:MAG: esterase-like activity of phytase family protein [Rhizobiales bacterium]|nr:esterase-like activity of phytase family protein [Hyphomicrobiales bacterium]
MTRTRLTRRAWLAGGLGLAAGAGGLAALGHGAEKRRTGPAPGPDQPTPVSARTIRRFEITDPTRTRFGALEFRSGLALASTHPDFGGFSGLRLSQQGKRLLAVTDSGDWLAAAVETTADGALTGLSDARIGPVLGPRGEKLATSGRWDCEALAEGPEGTVYVGIERVDEIWRFDIGRDGLLARGAQVPVPAGMRRWPGNKGPEALAVAPAGSPHAGGLIVVAERAFGHRDVTAGFVIGGPNPCEFRMRRRDDFDVSDCCVLPSGDLMILERRFRWSDGMAIRLRRLAIAELKPNAVVEGRQVFEATMMQDIDNMEGLAAHRDGAGDTILTMISDDNFNWFQRTLLLQFRLVE